VQRFKEGRQQGAATIWEHRDGSDRLGKHLEAVQLAPARDVPQVQRSIDGRQQGVATIRQHRDRSDRPGKSLEAAQLGPALDVPQMHQSHRLEAGLVELCREAALSTSLGWDASVVQQSRLLQRGNRSQKRGILEKAAG
jgi:hypothetical protein